MNQGMDVGAAQRQFEANRKGVIADALKSMRDAKMQGQGYLGKVFMDGSECMCAAGHICNAAAARGLLKKTVVPVEALLPAYQAHILKVDGIVALHVYTAPGHEPKCDPSEPRIKDNDGIREVPLSLCEALDLDAGMELLSGDVIYHLNDQREFSLVAIADEIEGCGGIESFRLH